MMSLFLQRATRSFTPALHLREARPARAGRPAEATRAERAAVELRVAAILFSRVASDGEVLRVPRVGSNAEQSESYLRLWERRVPRHV